MTTEREAQGQGAPRREQILTGALAEFSHKGFHGGSTVTIAEKAGSSHPGLFRTFPTKKRLFLATLEQVFTTIERELAVANQATEGDRLHATVMAWRSLMEKRELMLLLIQGYAACEDSEIQDRMYRWTRETFEHMEALSKADAGPDNPRFATALLYTVASCMDLSARTEGEAWAGRLLASNADP
ncbi:TetR/AcrR family transcriptional regulator [Nocardiopsis sp. L17-MgMaSL7]|uniref:TetR/AcrR family transcriptional regulator n=1 Tax=Nocardiopsis sp. L17-MgMaSL7 TaxID=1938893 RepID=UPI000D71B65F|nr:TetR/AcrR family transcriptional regulator [Nocardiopsis sp. L17-MgMaSL7]PWV55358.1 TetR family transcriptional regulator [Nocardiopsis sp. L17-MgMaSL7]